jgi:hypothetical protein
MHRELSRADLSVNRQHRAKALDEKAADQESAQPADVSDERKQARVLRVSACRKRRASPSRRQRLRHPTGHQALPSSINEIGHGWADLWRHMPMITGQSVHKRGRLSPFGFELGQPYTAGAVDDVELAD